MSAMEPNNMESNEEMVVVRCHSHCKKNQARRATEGKFHYIRFLPLKDAVATILRWAIGVGLESVEQPSNK